MKKWRQFCHTYSNSNTLSFSNNLWKIACQGLDLENMKIESDCSLYIGRKKEF